MLIAVSSQAQNTDALGTYTPYSLFGIGDLANEGTSVNSAMGGIGTGLRTRRFINYLNPASITERDTLSFMMDFGLLQRNIYNSDGNVHSAYNTYNMQNIVFTAPIYRKSAIIVGIAPYSNIGYKFESTGTDKDHVLSYGDIRYRKYGEGSINNLFVGGAMNFLHNFSFGAEMVYYFGALDRYSNIEFNSESSLRNLVTGWDYAVNSVSGRFGLQYFNTLKKRRDLKFTAGISYSLKSRLSGDMTQFAYAENTAGTDTIRHITYNSKMEIPGKISVGVSLSKMDTLSRTDIWTLGFDYTRQDWSNSNFLATPGVDFNPNVESSYRLGFSYTPNINDIRYYRKRMTYRVGTYYKTSYIRVGNNDVHAFGITFGATFPISKINNVINFAVDVGQRGSTKNGMIRERYVNFVLNFSLYDIWFIKRKYR
jgi:hypothetical protein